MTKKIQQVIWIILMCIPLLILAMSGIMKISGNTTMVQDLTQIGYGGYITLLGIVELASAILFIIPRTYKIGFLLLCGYLGGAFATELAHGQPPIAALLLTLIWISVFLRDKEMFLAA